MAGALILGDGIRFPLTAVTESIGVLAARGAGKSNAAAVMAEEMYDNDLPFVVVDPVGAWWGLRSGKDGKAGEGLSIPIFGGEHGDVPLERNGGTMLADLIVTERLSCVLDLTGFDSENDKKHFLLPFAQRLYAKNRDPLHLFLEEADDYIPQKPMRDEAYLLRAWENIIRRGRARGLGVTLITQRSAAINKNALTQCQTLITLRTTGPQDQEAIRQWIKYHGQSLEIMASLAGLKDGEAWIYSPNFLRKTFRGRFYQRETYDSGATPKTGAAPRKPARLADVDLGAIREKMADTIERVEADDPKRLKREIAQLRAQVAKGPPELPKLKIETKIKEVPMLKPALINRMEKLLAKAGDVSGQISAGAAEIHSAVDFARRMQDNGKVGVEMRPIRIDPKTLYRPESLDLKLKKGSMFNSVGAGRPADDKLPKGERAILTAVVQGKGADRGQLTQLTGYKRSSRDAFISRLISKGLLQIGIAGSINPTDQGVAALGDYEPLPTGNRLYEYWLPKLPIGEAAILKIAHDAGEGQSVTKEHIDAKVGYKRSSRDAFISRLAARKLVTSDRGVVTASSELYD